MRSNEISPAKWTFHRAPLTHRVRPSSQSAEPWSRERRRDLGLASQCCCHAAACGRGRREVRLWSQRRGCVQRELSASGAQNVCDTYNTRRVQYHVDAHRGSRNIGSKSIRCQRQKCKLLPWKASVACILNGTCKCFLLASCSKKEYNLWCCVVVYLQFEKMQVLILLKVSGSAAVVFLDIRLEWKLLELWLCIYFCSSAIQGVKLMHCSVLPIFSSRG